MCTCLMHVANRVILQLRIFNGRCHFRLCVLASTGEYFYYWHWRLLPKVLQGINDAKTFKNLVVSFYALYSQQIIRILQKIGSHLTGTLKIMLIQWFILSDLIGRISSYGSFSFTKGQQPGKITQDVNKKNIG